LAFLLSLLRYEHGQLQHPGAPQGRDIVLQLPPPADTEATDPVLLVVAPANLVLAEPAREQLLDWLKPATYSLGRNRDKQLLHQDPHIPGRPIDVAREADMLLPADRNRQQPRERPG